MGLRVVAKSCVETELEYVHVCARGYVTKRIS